MAGKAQTQRHLPRRRPRLQLLPRLPLPQFLDPPLRRPARIPHEHPPEIRGTAPQFVTYLTHSITTPIRQLRQTSPFRQTGENHQPLRFNSCNPHDLRDLILRSPTHCPIRPGDVNGIPCPLRIPPTRHGRNSHFLHRSLIFINLPQILSPVALLYDSLPCNPRPPSACMPTLSHRCHPSPMTIEAPPRTSGKHLARRRRATRTRRSVSTPTATTTAPTSTTRPCSTSPPTPSRKKTTRSAGAGPAPLCSGLQTAQSAGCENRFHLALRPRESSPPAIALFLTPN